MVPDVVAGHFESIGAGEEDADGRVEAVDGCDEDVLGANVTAEGVEGGRGFVRWERDRGGWIAPVELGVVFAVAVAVAVVGLWVI